MNTMNTIRTDLASAKTVTDFSGVLDTLEQTTDDRAHQIKDKYKRSIDEIHSNRHQPGEATRRMDEAREATTEALGDLREGYEAMREEILTTATRRAFPVASTSNPESILARRDAMSRAQALADEISALDLLARSFEVNDHELVGALVREGHRRDWSQVVREVAVSGTQPQRRGAETLIWIAETRRRQQDHLTVLIGGARFSVPTLDRPRLGG